MCLRIIFWGTELINPITAKLFLYKKSRKYFGSSVLTRCHVW